MYNSCTILDSCFDFRGYVNGQLDLLLETTQVFFPLYSSHCIVGNSKLLNVMAPHVTSTSDEDKLLLSVLMLHQHYGNHLQEFARHDGANKRVFALSVTSSLLTNAFLAIPEILPGQDAELYRVVKFPTIYVSSCAWKGKARCVDERLSIGALRLYSVFCGLFEDYKRIWASFFALLGGFDVRVDIFQAQSKLNLNFPQALQPSIAETLYLWISQLVHLHTYRSRPRELRSKISFLFFFFIKIMPANLLQFLQKIIRINLDKNI